jgi:hypothetical protein
MPTNNDEIERIKRIQEQQIRVRYDPNEKKAKFNQISAQRRQGTQVDRAQAAAQRAAAAGHQGDGPQCLEGYSF